MPSVLPYDIIAQIIDNVGENNDISLIKELALVSHSFHEICSKHLFATVDLHDNFPMRHGSSKKGFVKLLKRRPEVVKYIRKLTYNVEYGRFRSQASSTYYDDNLLLPDLPNFLRTISFLNCLTITTSKMVDWYTVDPSLTSAFLHLMHLPSINHIVLSSIEDFPLSSLTSSVNLRRLDIFHLHLIIEEDDFSKIVVLSEMMPKIREFNSTGSSLLTRKLLHAERQDGRPAFNFMDLRRFSTCIEDARNLRYLLQNAKLLEKLHLSATPYGSFWGLHDILSPSAHTLKELAVTVSVYSAPPPLGRLCEEVEAMAGDNMLEALSFELLADNCEAEYFIGSKIRNVAEVLVKPGWSALRQVSFKVSIAGSRYNFDELMEELESIPDKYLSHLSKPESIAFSYEYKFEHD